jgi:predicted Zn-dependent peptidase
MPHAQSVTTALFVAAGSRYEPAAISGISHFLEHMFFKGSRKRDNQLEIAKAIESVGGHLNAFTHQEATCFYARTLAEHFPLTMDVLCDMVLYPLFEADKLEMEKSVIIQEIRSMRDVPQSWVHEMLQEMMWKDQPLGRAIAGTEDTVGALMREECLEFKEHWYQPGNMVLAVAGRITHQQVLDCAAQYLDGKTNGAAADWHPAQETQSRPEILTEIRETEETHFCLGVRGLPRSHPDEYALRVLNTAMGAGMSSRLFQEIRERRGLAYSVGAYPHFFRDTGMWVVYASVHPQKMTETLEATMNELRRLTQTPVPAQELEEAKQFAKGGLLLSLESTANYAMLIGEYELLMGELITPDDIRAKLDTVTPEGTQRVVCDILRPPRLNLAVVGPTGGEAAWGRILDGVME